MAAPHKGLTAGATTDRPTLLEVPDWLPDFPMELCERHPDGNYEPDVDLDELQSSASTLELWAHVQCDANEFEDRRAYARYAVGSILDVLPKHLLKRDAFLDVAAEALAVYSADIIKMVRDNIIATASVTPTVAELVKAAKAESDRREVILRFYQGCVDAHLKQQARTDALFENVAAGSSRYLGDEAPTAADIKAAARALWLSDYWSIGRASPWWRHVLAGLAAGSSDVAAWVCDVVAVRARWDEYWLCNEFDPSSEAVSTEDQAIERLRDVGKRLAALPLHPGTPVKGKPIGGGAEVVGVITAYAVRDKAGTTTWHPGPHWPEQPDGEIEAYKVFNAGEPGKETRIRREDAWPVAEDLITDDAVRQHGQDLRFWHLMGPVASSPHQTGMMDLNPPTKGNSERGIQHGK